MFARDSIGNISSTHSFFLVISSLVSNISFPEIQSWVPESNVSETFRTHKLLSVSSITNCNQSTASARMLLDNDNEISKQGLHGESDSPINLSSEFYPSWTSFRLES